MRATAIPFRVAERLGLSSVCNAHDRAIEAAVAQIRGGLRAWTSAMAEYRDALAALRRASFEVVP